jgi:DNA-binding NarL/FixJ family response regulator
MAGRCRPGVGQAGDSTQLLNRVRENAPDLVLVDIRMPPTHTVEGLEAAGVIREEFPETGILVLSAHVEVEHATRPAARRFDVAGRAGGSSHALVPQTRGSPASERG